VSIALLLVGEYFDKIFEGVDQSQHDYPRQKLQSAFCLKIIFHFAVSLFFLVHLIFN